MTNDFDGCQSAHHPSSLDGSASEPTATLTRMQAIRAFHESHPEATVPEIVTAMCCKGIGVDECMVEQAIARA